MKLLLDPNKCPVCGNKGTISFDTHRCLECLNPLFKQGQDYGRYEEETGFKHYFVFMPNDPARGKFRGWIASEHLEAPKPNEGKEKKALSL